MFKVTNKRLLDNFKVKIDRQLLIFLGGLGGNVGTVGLIFISNLAKELGIKCDAIVTKPFKFEGLRRYNYANEAIEKSSVNNIFIIDSNCGAFFEEIDSLVLDCLDCYITKYLNSI